MQPLHALLSSAQKASPFTMDPPSPLPSPYPMQRPDVIFREWLDFQQNIIGGDVTNCLTYDEASNSSTPCSRWKLNCQQPGYDLWVAHCPISYKDACLYDGWKNQVCQLFRLSQGCRNPLPAATRVIHTTFPMRYFLRVIPIHMFSSISKCWNVRLRNMHTLMAFLFLT